MFPLDKEPPGVWKPRRKYMLTVLRQHGLGKISRPMMLIFFKFIVRTNLSCECSVYNFFKSSCCLHSHYKSYNMPCENNVIHCG